MTPRRLATLAILAGSFGVWLLRHFPPGAYGFYPQCPIHALLGVQCPGCGATRALAALLHGQIVAAVHFNALTVVAIPFGIAFAGESLRRAFGREPFTWPAVPNAAAYGALALTMAFGMARNLGWSGFTVL